LLIACGPVAESWSNRNKMLRFYATEKMLVLEKNRLTREKSFDFID